MFTQLGGSGCTTRCGGLPEHNPRPSTERGKRRHAARSDAARKHAESAWESPRCTDKSRYQKAMSGRSSGHF